MLPFMKKKNEPSAAGLIVKTRTPDESPEQDQDDPKAAHIACGQEIKAAIESGDGLRIAQAIQDLMDLGPIAEEPIEPSQALGDE